MYNMLTFWVEKRIVVSWHFGGSMNDYVSLDRKEVKIREKTIVSPLDFIQQKAR